MGSLNATCYSWDHACLERYMVYAVAFIWGSQSNACFNCTYYNCCMGNTGPKGKSLFRAYSCAFIMGNNNGCINLVPLWTCCGFFNHAPFQSALLGAITITMLILNIILIYDFYKPDKDLLKNLDKENV